MRLRDELLWIWPTSLHGRPHKHSDSSPSHARIVVLVRRAHVCERSICCSERNVVGTGGGQLAKGWGQQRTRWGWTFLWRWILRLKVEHYRFQTKAKLQYHSSTLTYAVDEGLAISTVTKFLRVLKWDYRTGEVSEPLLRRQGTPLPDVPIGVPTKTERSAARDVLFGIINAVVGIPTMISFAAIVFKVMPACQRHSEADF